MMFNNIGKLHKMQKGSTALHFTVCQLLAKHCVLVGGELKFVFSHPFNSAYLGVHGRDKGVRERDLDIELSN